MSGCRAGGFGLVVWGLWLEGRCLWLGRGGGLGGGCVSLDWQGWWSGWMLRMFVLLGGRLTLDEVFV